MEGARRVGQGELVSRELLCSASLPSRPRVALCSQPLFWTPHPSSVQAQVPPVFLPQPDPQPFLWTHFLLHVPLVTLTSLQARHPPASGPWCRPSPPLGTLSSQVSERSTSFTSPPLLGCHLFCETFPDHSADNYSRLHPHFIFPHSVYCYLMHCVYSVHLPCRARAPQGQASPACFVCSSEPRTCTCPATICRRNVLSLSLWCHHVLSAWLGAWGGHWEHPLFHSPPVSSWPLGLLKHLFSAVHALVSQLLVNGPLHRIEWGLRRTRVIECAK